MGDAGRRRRRLDLSSSYPSPPPFPSRTLTDECGALPPPRRPHQTPFADPPCIPDDRRGFQLLLLLFVTHLEMEWREMKIAAVFFFPGVAAPLALAWRWRKGLISPLPEGPR